MENTSFCFQISPYNMDKLLPQVSKALEKRTELLSRKNYPSLWNTTDKLNSIAHGRTRSKFRTKIMSAICIVLGVFLLVPGLLEPKELLVPLIAGGLAVCSGMIGLWNSRNHKKNPFDNSARRLLDGKDSFSAKQPVTVLFSDKEMIQSTVRENGTSDTEHIPYESFECIIETADTFLIVHDTRATVLQKIDLAPKSAEDFITFISEKSIQYHTIP